MHDSEIRIIGVGNLLMGDDGVGIAAVERLRSLQLPAGVEVIDGGTGGLALLDLMAGAQRVILIDAAVAGRAPGSIFRFTPEEVGAEQGQERGISMHAAGLQEVFALGREMGLLPPEIVIFGIEPAMVERRLGLSPAMETAVEEVVSRVLAEFSG